MSTGTRGLGRGGLGLEADGNGSREMAARVGGRGIAAKSSAGPWTAVLTNGSRPRRVPATERNRDSAENFSAANSGLRVVVVWGEGGRAPGSSVNKWPDG